MTENLASFAKDFPVINAKLAKLKLRRTLKGHISKVYSFEWAANSRTITSASQDGKLLVWDALTGNKLEVISLRSSWVMTCSISPNGNFLACGGLDNVCYIYQINKKESPTSPTSELSGHQGFIGCCRFIEDTKLVTASGDYSCGYWDLQTSQQLLEFKEHKGEVMCVALNPMDKHLFLSAASDGTVKYWDVRTPKSVHGVKVHDLDVNWVSFFPNGQAFGSASDDKTCRLYDLRAHAEVMKYSSPDVECPISSISFSKSGHILFAGQEDHTVSAWDTLKGDKIYTLSGHQDRVSGVAVSPDGMALCTASWDHELRIWA